MREDVIRSEVIALTRRIETELGNHRRLRRASRRLRKIIANIGNAEHQGDGDDD